MAHFSWAPVSSLPLPLCSNPLPSLRNQGTVAWTPTGAVLVGSKREELPGLTVWPLEPIPPGKSKRVVVELDATESEARGSYMLKLWAGEAGAGSVNLVPVHG